MRWQPLFSLADKKEGGLTAPTEQRPMASGCACRDLVEGRVGNFIGLNLRSSFNHFRQASQYF
jgi:hypothetical protein